MVEPDDRFGREFCPRSGRPPYFDESFSRRHQGGLGWLSGAPTTPGQHGHLGAPLSDLRRRATGGTASALGLDLLEAAVAAQNDDGQYQLADHEVDMAGGLKSPSGTPVPPKRRPSLLGSLSLQSFAPFVSPPAALQRRISRGGGADGDGGGLLDDDASASPRRTSSYGYFASPAHGSLAPSAHGRGGSDGSPLPNNALQPDLISKRNAIVPTWRLKERMKTYGVGMILALNIGTDPPDVVKRNPCAKLQCWIDPTTMSRAKARERIGEKLEQQYARWQQRARLKYKRALDPTVEDVRGLCVTMRRQARNERLLLHYNGHGVPRPTADGEIYVFDQNHTHFIPLSVLDMRRWIGKPTIIVLDCSGAGVLVPYLIGSLDHPSPSQQTPSKPHQGSDGGTAVHLNAGDGLNRMKGESESAYAARTVKDTIVLCPTSAGDLLPLGPEFPADLFTSCLTTPIPVALRWFVHQNRLSRVSPIDPDLVDSIPGKTNDRKTPLGELNWIFTAITDTIAWNVLPSPLFQRLFRQDLIVASMFRNFLLADRILRHQNCTPLSHPALPLTHDHPLWQAWDLAVETCLDQLMRNGTLGVNGTVRASVPSTPAEDEGSDSEVSGGEIQGSRLGAGAPLTKEQLLSSGSTTSLPVSSKKSITAPFFAEQLTAFEIWLDFASLKLEGSGGRKVLRFGQEGEVELGEESGDFFHLESPEQLPVVLQVLLSQAHRVRALALLRRFLDLGDAAVNLALSVGIFPYVLKLLQSSIDEYKHVLVGIWAKILKFDSSCQADLVKDGALPHFIRHLHWGLPDAGTSGLPPSTSPTVTASTIGTSEDAAEQRTMAAVILSAICADYTAGQNDCLEKNLHLTCASLLSSVEYLDTMDSNDSLGSERKLLIETTVPARFRLWLCLCLGNLVNDNAVAEAKTYEAAIHLRLFARLKDDVLDVRAGACYALGCLIGSAQDAEGTGHDDDSHVNSTASNPVPPTLPQVLPGMSSSFLPSASGLTMQANPGLNLSWQLNQHQQHQQPQVIRTQPPGLNTNNQMIYNPIQNTNPGGGLMPAPILGVASYPANFSAAPSISSPFQIQQQQLHQATQSEPHRPSTPSIYKDQRRLDFDLINARQLADTANEDGSPTVRYEAVLSLASFVRKYLHAFIAAADDTSSRAEDEPKLPFGGQTSPQAGSRLNILETIPDEGEDDLDGEDTATKRMKMPLGVTKDQAKSFTLLWSNLHSLQRKEPYKHVAYTLASLLAAVNENVFLLRTRFMQNDMDIKRPLTHESQPMLHGSNAANPSTMTEKSSDINCVGSSDAPILSLRRNITESCISQTTSKIDQPELLRSLSTQHVDAVDIVNLRVTDTELNFEYSPPSSRFYEWKRSEFGNASEKPRDLVSVPLDPLSHEGAIQIYREKRNLALHEESELLVEQFACLASNPMQQKKRSQYSGDLGNEVDLLNDLNGPTQKANAALEEEVAVTKQRLHLRQSAMLLNRDKQMTSMLKFHAYEPVLVVCDRNNTVSLWDINSAKRITSFRNGNIKKSRNSSLTWMNEMTSSLLMLGTDDGTVRIWDNIISNDGGIRQSTPQLASAFIAVPDLVAGQRGSGLVTEWQQYSGRLLAGGSSKSIYCWDLESEKCRVTLDNTIDCCVTTMTNAWDYSSSELASKSKTGGFSGIGPDIFVAGYENGALKVFDIRAKLEPVGGTDGVGQNNGIASRWRARRSRSMEYAEHKSWVVNTAFTGFGGQYEVVSGCVAGDVRFWDLRIPESIRTLDVQRSPMTAFACHPSIPVFCTGSHAQFIKILSMDGDVISVLRYHEEIAGQRIGPVSCLTFHPYKTILAAGATDEIVSIYRPSN